MKKALWVVAGLACAFLAGYVPQYLNSRQLSGELQEATAGFEAQLLEVGGQNRLLLLQRDLGMLLLEVEDRNYGMARTRSTRWFDQLNAVIASSGEDEAREVLGLLSQRRDALTGMLTEANPEAVTQVREMYRELANVTATD